MIFPLVLIPLTTLVFINGGNYIFKIKGLFNNVELFGTSFTSIAKSSTLLSLHINLIYSLML